MTDVRRGLICELIYAYDMHGETIETIWTHWHVGQLRQVRHPSFIEQYSLTESTVVNALVQTIETTCLGGTSETIWRVETYRVVETGAYNTVVK